MVDIPARLRAVFVIVASVTVVSALHAGAPQPSAQTQSTAYSGSDVFKTLLCRVSRIIGEG